jgi:general stress protein 26
MGRRRVLLDGEEMRGKGKLHFLRRLQISVVISTGIVLPGQLHAQCDTRGYSVDSLQIVARSIMASTGYATFTTLDSLGQPHTRTMEPFAPDHDMTVWLGTNRNSRKVRHVAANPMVSLHYPAPGVVGYVSIAATAILVDDPDEKARHWKESWDQFYPDREDYILIRVTPVRLEVLDLTGGITGDPVTWAVPAICYPR